MQHLYATARRHFLRRALVGCCEFPILYYYRTGAVVFLSPYRVSCSWLNQNSPDVAVKIGALNGFQMIK